IFFFLVVHSEERLVVIVTARIGCAAASHELVAERPWLLPLLAKEVVVVPLFLSFHLSCLLIRVVGDLAHKCPYIYGAVPRFLRRDLWQTCIASRLRLSFRSGALPLLLPYPMTCMLVSAMKTVWSTDALEVNGKWEGEVGNGLLVPITYCHGE
ncbi:unnamed protein product, partial [Prunus brigantina]